MQNKNNKEQLKKDLRHLHERVGATVLAFSLLTGTAAISTEARNILKGMAVHPVFAIIEHSTKESEVGRHLVRMDSVERSMPVGGSVD
jgi:hypothetical protein